ncbi:DUF1579 domain-containing protein [Chitinophaga lutea]
MKRITLALALLCACPLLTRAQDEAAQKKWMEYATPGEMQKMIAMSDGKWKADITFWMAPGSAPMTQTGECTNKMILGGRYQETRHTGTFGGQPFEGIGTLAYDNLRKVFQSTWIDNMGTGIMFMEGKWDEATHSVNLSGRCTDPATGKEMAVREVFKIIDDNTQQMEMYMMQDGKEFKSMEMKMTRM